MINSLNKLETEENFLNETKGIYQKLKVKTMLNGKMSKTFPLR